MPVPDAKILILDSQLNNLYGLYRGATTHTKYYGHRLASCKTWSIIMDGAALAGIVLLLFFGLVYGKFDGLTGILLGVIGLIGFIRAIKFNSDTIEHYAKLWFGYNCLAIKLDSITRDIALKKTWTSEIEVQFQECTTQHSGLRGISDMVNEKLDLKLWNKHDQETFHQIPDSSLWFPTVPQES